MRDDGWEFHAPLRVPGRVKPEASGGWKIGQGPITGLTSLAAGANASFSERWDKIGAAALRRGTGRLPRSRRRRLPLEATLIASDVGLGLAEEVPVRRRNIVFGERAAGTIRVSVMHEVTLAMSALGCIAAVVVRRANIRCGSIPNLSTTALAVAGMRCNRLRGARRGWYPLLR